MSRDNLMEIMFAAAPTVDGMTREVKTREMTGLLDQATQAITLATQTKHQTHVLTFEPDLEGGDLRVTVGEAWASGMCKARQTLAFTELVHLLLNMTPTERKAIADRPQDANGRSTVPDLSVLISAREPRV